MFGCCALQALVKICIFHIFCMFSEVFDPNMTKNYAIVFCSTFPPSCWDQINTIILSFQRHKNINFTFTFAFNNLGGPCGVPLYNLAWANNVCLCLVQTNEPNTCLLGHRTLISSFLLMVLWTIQWSKVNTLSTKTDSRNRHAKGPAHFTAPSVT